MKDLSLSSISRAMQKPFALEGPAAAKTPSPRPGTFAMVREKLNWAKVWFLGYWNDRDVQFWRNVILIVWLGLPVFIGLFGGLMGDFRGNDSDLKPYSHHYQKILPSFDVGHYLGTKLRHLGSWFTE